MRRVGSLGKSALPDVERCNPELHLTNLGMVPTPMLPLQNTSPKPASLLSRRKKEKDGNKEDTIRLHINGFH